ncbi:hypothetical protein AnigIFM60653_011991 [Aspergillus niger]|uniref:BYS1 domain protein n=3 Tax=Aspergillus TaxID=5052 RepID=A0A3F3PLR1_9EURO|nr:hypothetical protein BDQ94DRAFT_153275 [Aspergillus welwitschiae]KAI2826274.1 hypothetical protein CBS133816_7678 [Aspergillus niger]RDK38446.1 hypothetical protein M752DRAFT_279038 [Aspergillus phoenicis ATCC 13157]KAI2974247.1 hypothetical protein CBS147323_1636 [Aspergillus niger]KAI2982444.1 hypothetical protein CBS147482_10150 [Aspergillus niger]KAI2994219.1 hypothetical protein CBS147346_10615 [Aspergillus niger]
MHLSTKSLLSLLPLLPLASAVGSAIVQNNCTSPIYLWSVGGSVSSMQTIDPGSSYSETFYYDTTSGGVALKITTTENGLYNGSPQTDYAYTLDTSSGNVFYDISDVFGDPFSGSVVSLVSSDSSCESICWAGGVPPAGSVVRSCQDEADEVLTVCADSC